MLENAQLLEDLNSFNQEVRLKALKILAKRIVQPTSSLSPSKNLINLHAHTFFSYNYLDYSPSRLVWEALQANLTVIGSVDFDVLDAMEEMFIAGELLHLRTVSSLETRVFVESYQNLELNSPGEPGVFYYMGVGFTKLPVKDSTAFKTLKNMQIQARKRNEELISRINKIMCEASINYITEVLPLTPQGNATERHILAAYDQKAKEVFSDPHKLINFWSDILQLPTPVIQDSIFNTSVFRNLIRSKLMKKGGIGYVQPDNHTFPAISEVTEMITSCQALPCHAWLDGSLSGEQDAEKLLDDSISWGCLCVNIIPERNYNITDPVKKSQKVSSLYKFISAAKKRNLPIIIGTEMNNYGQPLFDNLNSPELSPFAQDFLEGALWLYGHTYLERHENRGLLSDWSKNTFGNDRKKANQFYLTVGKNNQP